MTDIPVWIKEIIDLNLVTEDEIKEQEQKLKKKIEDKGVEYFKSKLLWAKGFVINSINQMDSMGCYPMESYEPMQASLWIIDQIMVAIDKDTYRLAALVLINRQLMVKCEQILKQICGNLNNFR